MNFSKAGIFLAADMVSSSAAFLFMYFSAYFLEQAEVDDLTEWNVADGLFHLLDLLRVKFETGFAGGAVAAERLCQRRVGFAGDGVIDFPLPFYDLDRVVGTFSGENKTTIQRSQQALRELAFLGELAVGRSVTIAGKFD